LLSKAHRVIESFENLLAACYQDFAPLYERLAVATDIEPFGLIEGDEVLTRGTLTYFNKGQHSRLLQAPSDLSSNAISTRSDLTHWDFATPLPNAHFSKGRISMQPSSLSTFQPRPSPKEAIPYSNEAMRQDLDRLRDTWEDVQSSRDRKAIYGYLTAVYDLLAWWTAEGQEIDRARRALRLQRLDVSEREDAFAAVIRCTADPAKADKRTRSKWRRVMRYAAVYKPDSEPFDRFVRRKGGINACAVRFTRRLGRGALHK
jgi:hypothetical protein